MSCSTRPTAAKCSTIWWIGWTGDVRSKSAVPHPRLLCSVNQDEKARAAHPGGEGVARPSQARGAGEPPLR